MIKTRFLLFAMTLVLWLLLNFSFSPAYLVTGVLIGLFVTWMSEDIFDSRQGVFRKISRYGWFIYYILVFLWECFKANLDGAWRVLHPDLPINPGIVKVRTRLTSDLGLTFLSNSLTLKPGTMTVDVDKENGVLYVHWVDVRTRDIEGATKMIVRKFEDILLRIFS